MPALSDPTTWRKPYHTDGFLFVLKPRVVFAAQINMASQSYPLTSLTFDTVTTGAYTAIRPGMTLILGNGPGTSNLGRQRVRDVATSTVIPIGRTPRGLHWGELNVADNMYITVLDFYECWSKIPFITEDGVSLKDQTAFAANIAQPPVANGGCAVADFVTDDELVVDFDGTDSFFVDASASSLTYFWEFEDATPPTSTSATPTGISFPAGFRNAHLTVNDGTRAHTTHIPVYAGERTGENAPIAVEADAFVLRPEGDTASFTLRAVDLDPADYPYGTLVIYFQEEFYDLVEGSLAGPTGREKVKFVGWLDMEPTSIQYSGTGPEKRVTLTALSVAQRLAVLPGFSQIVERKDSPATWQEMNGANIDRYVHHILHWHSTALSVAPFQWSGLGSIYPFMALSSDGQNLYQQADQRAAAISYRLTCTRRGELLMRADPQRLNPVDRTPEIMADIADTDWSAVQYQGQPRPQAHWGRGNAVLASATEIKSVFSVAPGATPGQGESETETGQQLARSQDEVNVWTGNDYVRMNAEQGVFTLTLTHGGDAGLDPAFMEWVRWGISAETAAQRKLIMVATTRFLLLETRIEHDFVARTQTQTIQIEREVSGFPAETHIPATVSTTSPDYPAIPITDTYGNWPEDYSVITDPGYPISPTVPIGRQPKPDASGNMVLIAQADWVAITTNFKLSNTLKCKVITPDLGAGEVVQQAVWGLGVDVYVLVSDGTNSRVFYCENALEATVSYAVSDSIEGAYTMIEAMSTDGQVKIQGIKLVSGDCDFSAWTVWAAAGGTFVEATTDHITVHAVDGGDGNWYAGVKSPGPSVCCCSITGTVVGDVPVIGANPCGASQANQDFVDFSYTGDAANAMAYKGPDEFEVMVFSADPCAEGGSIPVTLVAYSSDFGETFAAAKELTPSLSANVGFEVDKIGNTSLVAEVGQVMIATTANGDYAAYGDPLPEGIAANCIFLPRNTFAGTNNAALSTPQYIVASMALSDDDTSIFRATGAGEVFTSITPAVSGDFGTIVGPHALVCPWKTPTKIAAIFDFDGTRRLMTSGSSGAGWSTRGVLTEDAAYIRMRKGDTLYKELYIADGESVRYSKDFGATLVSKTLPVSGTVRSVEVYG